MHLSDRLAMVASFVTPGSCISDVGCDHGYLSIWLVENDVCKRIIASDIRPGPLQKGMDNAERFGVDEKIEFRLCDGLADIEESEVDEIVICGMGGEVISTILSDSPWSLKKRLILNPASKADQLRSFLYSNGMEIVSERLVMDSGLMYNVIEARPGNVYLPSPAETYVSPALLVSGDPLLEKYLNRIEGILEDAYRGTAASSKAHDVERCEFFRQALEGVIEMKRKICHD
ncbi:MAG: SAM-dependent methyltransferase [Ruminococcaceae bacterium]|nr:SAM-dependent methyltransferase [Oscillospiraceae bacterium]